MHGIQSLPGIAVCPVCGFCDTAPAPGFECRACGVSIADQTALSPIVLLKADGTADPAGEVEFELAIPAGHRRQVSALETLFAFKRT